ncbi:MFS transporter [Streptomyces sp. NPDC048606]|uniref:MFS transporter n=1 Tax=Streptomyces sp. NPDC048606 TaxID=3154726 RepID=UPI0034162395
MRRAGDVRERVPDPYFPGAWPTARLLVLFMVVNFADKAVLGLAGPEIMDELGLTRKQFGSAQAAFFALFSLSAIGVSLLTRRVRSSVLLLAMALTWSAAQLPMLWPSAGLGVLIATRVLLGAAEGPAAPVAAHHLYGWFAQRDRTLPTAVLLIGAAAGVALAAPVLTWVIAAWGWRWAFGTVGLAGIGWAAVWALRGREGPLAPPVGAGPLPQRAGPGGEAGGEAAGAGDHGAVAGDDGPPLGRILTSPSVLAAGFACFAVYWQISAQLTWVPDYLHTALGWSAGATGLAVAAGSLANAAVLLTHGLLARRAGVRGARAGPVPAGAGPGLLMVGAAAAVAAFVVGPPWLKVAMMCGPMALCAPMMTVGQTVCARISPAHRRGSVLGVVVGVSSLGGVVSPVVLGRIVDGAPEAVTGYGRAWLLTALLLALAGTLAALFLRPERDADRLAVPPEGIGRSAPRVPDRRPGPPHRRGGEVHGPAHGDQEPPDAAV